MSHWRVMLAAMVCAAPTLGCGTDPSNPDEYGKFAPGTETYEHLAETAESADGFMLVRATSPTYAELELRSNSVRWRAQASENDGQLARLFANCRFIASFSADDPRAPTPPYVATLIVFHQDRAQLVEIVETVRDPEDVHGYALSVSGNGGDTAYYAISDEGQEALVAMGLAEARVATEPDRAPNGAPNDSPASGR